jgi:predicted ABC-class ATPase
VKCAEDATCLREKLRELGLVGFVGNGSILPRRSGANDEPMAGPGVIPFQSPPSMLVIS